MSSPVHVGMIFTPTLWHNCDRINMPTAGLNMARHFIHINKAYGHRIIIVKHVPFAF